MSWSVLQSAKGTGSSVSSETATFTTANISAGSKIIAAISIGATSAPAISSVTATGGNTLTQIGTASQGNARIYLYAIDAAGSGGTTMVGTKPTITATFAAAGGLGIVIQEVSGLAAGNTVAAMADGTAGTLTGTTASTGSPAYSSSAANEYLVSCYADFGSGVTPAAAGGWTLETNSIRGSTDSDCIIQYKNSTGGSESDGFTSADTGGWAIVEVAFKLAAASSPAWVPQSARRAPHRVQGLPPQRRFRQLLPVPKQLSPPYPFTQVAQRRETWPRGLPRRGRRAWPVPPQLNPPYPFTELRQQRQPRGLFPRRGHGFTPVPAQQAAAQAPAFVPQALRHARLAAAALRRRPAAVPPAQDTPPPQPRHARPAVPPPRRSRPPVLTHGQHAPPPQRPPGRQRWPLGRRARVTWPPGIQAPAAPPAWVQSHRSPPRAIALLIRRGRVAWPPQAQAAAAPPPWVQSHRGPLRAAVPSRRGRVTTPPHGQAHAPLIPQRRGPLRAIALIRRRFRQLMPWPQATRPAFSIGALTAADKASGVLTAAGGSGALTAATAAASTLTAGDQRTGGPG